MPDAELVLHYFQDKFVYGDDPFTNQTEPSIPFNLYVVVQNVGYGIAQNLTILSAQPTIVENDKDVAVSFQIIGAELGKNPISPSLTVSFGNISPGDITVARWIMISSLWGQFENYTATFHNINPLGDPTLSIFANVTFNELIRVVKTNNVNYSDGDMLINVNIDGTGIPDTIYNVTDGHFYGVAAVNASSVAVSHFIYGTRTYSRINVTIQEPHQYGWIAMRTEWPNDIQSGSTLLLGEDRQGNMLPEQNFWETNSILFELGHWISVFDENYPNKSCCSYSIVAGLPNLNPPVFDESSLNIILPNSLNQPGKVIGKLKANDIDNDEIEYTIEDNNYVSVSKADGSVTLKQVQTESEILLNVFATDKAIPAQTANATMSIVIEKPTSTVEPISVITTFAQSALHQETSMMASTFLHQDTTQMITSSTKQTTSTVSGASTSASTIKSTADYKTETTVSVSGSQPFAQKTTEGATNSAITKVVVTVSTEQAMKSSNMFTTASTKATQSTESTIYHQTSIGIVSESETTSTILTQQSSYAGKLSTKEPTSTAPLTNEFVTIVSSKTPIKPTGNALQTTMVATSSATESSKMPTFITLIQASTVESHSTNPISKTTTTTAKKESTSAQRTTTTTSAAGNCL